jgi:hypothetical protein
VSALFTTDVVYSVYRVNNVAILYFEFGERTEQVSSSSKGWFFHSEVCSLKSRMFRELYEKKKKGKGKFFPVHVMKAYRGSRGITPLILNLNLNTRFGCSNSRPGRFASDKERRYPLCTYVNCAVSGI